MEKLITITTANEIDREKPYTAETFRRAGAERLARLQEIRELLESEGYEQRRAAFEKEQERLMQKWWSYTAHIGEWEEEMTQKIMSDPALSEEEKSKKMQSEVYAKVQEMFKQAESGEACQKAMGEYGAFLRNNQLRSGAAGYRLERTSPEGMTFFNLSKSMAGD